MFTLLLAAGYVALLPIIIPAMVWFRYASWISRQPPGQRVELTKASHGAGMLVLSGLIVMLVHDQGGTAGASPLLWVPLAVMSVWGGLWLVTSGLQARRYGLQGPTDTVVLIRSLVKAAVGIAVIHFIPVTANEVLLGMQRTSDVWVVLFGSSLIAAWFAGAWCLTTGAAKVLLLLLSGIRRARKIPAPMQNPRGGARDASRAEARRAMRGQGGVASSLDQQEF